MSDAPQIDAALDAIRRAVQPSTVIGIYLYGSAVAGGLRPDSDIDLLVVVGRRLIPAERHGLADALRPLSRRALRPREWRPLEVTVVAQRDVRPWRYPPMLDLQYGEWLDDADMEAAIARGSIESPDLAVVLEMVRTAGHSLVGPPADEVLDPVASADLVRAMVDEVPSLLDDLKDDTRNVLLTLARMWCTLEVGEIRSKDAAADWAIERLPQVHRPQLAVARDRYLLGDDSAWEEGDAVALADALVERIRRAAS